MPGSHCWPSVRDDSGCDGRPTPVSWCRAPPAANLRHSALAGAMHSCMAPGAGQAALLSRGCTACGSYAGRRQQASARHAAALQHRRRPTLCRAQQQDAEQGEQQAEAPMSESGLFAQLTWSNDIEPLAGMYQK